MAAAGAGPEALGWSWQHCGRSRGEPGKETVSKWSGFWPLRWEAAPQGESRYHHTVKFEVSLGSSSPACVTLHIRDIGGQMLGRGLSCAWRGVEQQPWPPPAHTVVTPAVSPGITQCGGKMASGGEPQLYLANGLVFRRGELIHGQSHTVQGQSQAGAQGLTHSPGLPLVQPLV